MEEHIDQRNLKNELIRLFSSAELPAILEYLKAFRATGGKRSDAECILNSIVADFEEQKKNTDSVRDVLDFVTGFCHPANRIWHDAEEVA